MVYGERNRKSLSKEVDCYPQIVYIDGMKTLLETLYNLLSFITEDARAHGIVKLPEELMAILNATMVELEHFMEATYGQE